MAGYADFSTAYLTWLKSQLDYINNSKAYVNFSVTIDPSYEITSFKQATDVNQQQIFHNAADDQVAVLRAIKEIAKSPSDYLDEYATYLGFEMATIQATANTVNNTHNTQISSNSGKATLSFFSTFAPDAMNDFGQYNPMRIFS